MWMVRGRKKAAIPARTKWGRGRQKQKWCAHMDQLAVAGVVGKGQGFVVRHLQEAARPSAELQIGPASLGHRGHVEAALLAYEIGLGTTRAAVEQRGATLEAACVVSSAAVVLLCGFDRRRAGDVSEGVGHGGFRGAARPLGQRMTVTMAAPGAERNLYECQFRVSNPERMGNLSIRLCCADRAFLDHPICGYV